MRISYKPLWRILLERDMSKKDYDDFYKAVSGIENAYLDTLREDVSWFCKKFDYRYADEPWYNSKDAIERATAFLNGRV